MKVQVLAQSNRSLVHSNQKLCGLIVDLNKGARFNGLPGDHHIALDLNSHDDQVARQKAPGCLTAKSTSCSAMTRTVPAVAPA